MSSQLAPQTSLKKYYTSFILQKAWIVKKSERRIRLDASFQSPPAGTNCFRTFSSWPSQHSTNSLSPHFIPQTPLLNHTFSQIPIYKWPESHHGPRFDPNFPQNSLKERQHTCPQRSPLYQATVLTSHVRLWTLPSRAEQGKLSHFRPLFLITPLCGSFIIALGFEFCPSMKLD
jgi:hypothetical protein